MTALRGQIHCLKMGSLKKLDAGHGYIAYARFDAEDCAVVVVNVADSEITLAVPVWEAEVPVSGKMKLVLSTAHELESGEEYRVKYGRLRLCLPPKSACVFACKFSKRARSQQMSIFG